MFLALRYSAGNQSIVNGNWSLDWSGDYKAAGTTVEYKKSRQRLTGENIYIKGPLTEEIQLLVRQLLYNTIVAVALQYLKLCN